jgi:hypothetical protein
MICDSLATAVCERSAPTSPKFGYDIVRSKLCQLLCCIAAIPLFSGPLLAQPAGATGTRPAKTPLSSGMISGRVFGITGNGDLKPARFAKVYLLGSAEEKDKKSAVVVFLETYNSELASLNDWVRSNGDLSEEVVCRKSLLIVEDALSAVLDWTEKVRKPHELQSIQADEEGSFRISGVSLGYHMLVIRGRTGFNEAYWQADVSVSPGRNASLKLGSPETSCSELAH